MSRIATVFLGTSLQGSSAIDALLADGTFTPRAVTRNANSPAARSLATRGVQIAEARFDDKEAVRRAVEGAEVVFLAMITDAEQVTMPFSDVPEVTQGINVIDASKEAGVEFVVLSSLPSISEFSHGKYTHAVEFDDKDTIRKYLEKSGIPCASIYPGNFMENFPRGVLDCPFEKTPTGYILNTREQQGTRCVQVWIKHDMGQAVVALFKAYQTRLADIDKQAFVLGSVRATIEEVAVEFAKGLGKPVEVRRHGKFGDLAADDIYDALKEFDVFPGIEIPDPRLKALGVKVGTLEEFARTVLREHVENK